MDALALARGLRSHVGQGASLMEWVHAISFDLDWASPSEAKRWLNQGLHLGHLEDHGRGIEVVATKDGARRLSWAGPLPPWPERVEPLHAAIQVPDQLESDTQELLRRAARGEDVRQEARALLYSKIERWDAQRGHVGHTRSR